MKGLVFTELFRHVEALHGANMVDDIIAAAQLPHDGGYTSIGSYPFQEAVALLVALTQATGKSLPDTLDAFGTHCFRRWVNYAPHFFTQQRGLFDILEGIDDFHETEVRKLYPDAELPSFLSEQRTERQLTLGYYSCKPLSALAVGVIKGAAAHVKQPVHMECEPATNERGAYTRITITLLDS